MIQERSQERLYLLAFTKQYCMTSHSIQQSQKGIPANITRFLVKGLALFIGWNLLYNLVLQPWGMLDKALTNALLNTTVRMLSLFFNDVYQMGNAILVEGKASITIADACNGLELMALYLGYFILMPAGWKKITAYALGGLLMIMLLNTARCSLLAYLYQHDISTAHFAHKYAFKLAVYAFVFLAWMRYSKTSKNESVQS